MSSVEQHELVLAATYPSGAEEWTCPTCGRRLLVNWPTGCEALTLERGEKFCLAWGREVGTAVATKTLLNPGDADAFHSGRRPDSDLDLSAPNRIPPDDVEPLSAAGSLRDLTRWQMWLEDLDFGDWNPNDLEPL